MKKILFILSIALLGSTLALSAQKILPPSFNIENSLINVSNTYRVEFTQNKELLINEDLDDVKNGHPLRIAVGIPTEINLFDNMEDSKLISSQKIIQQAVKSEDADGLILSFDKFFIPEGDQLFVYTKDGTQIEVYTHETNPQANAYATGILYQDEIILEYVKSEETQQEPDIRISNIGYVYRSLKAIQDATTCFINISCEEGAAWQLQKNGVVGLRMHLLKNGKYDYFICSGSLINNARQDKTPYILTANHCIDGYYENTFATLEFTFFKEANSSLSCYTQTNLSNSAQILIGCELIADIPLNGGSDGTLLRITQDIPENWDVYYNGWDATGETSQSGVVIHHPNGMVKKISTYTTALRSAGNIPFENEETGVNQYTARRSNWEVRWASTVNGQSVTFGGSSGSPLFNQNGLIIGTLTGGSSKCDNPYNPDYFGKFSYHWDQYRDETQHFKNFLDPDNTGILVLQGYRPENTTTIKHIETDKNENFLIYLNENTMTISVMESNLINEDFYLYDVSGSLIKSGKITQQEEIISRDNLPKGLYLIQIGEETQKVILN